MLNEFVNIGGHEATVNDVKQLDSAIGQLGDLIFMSFNSSALGGVIVAGVEEIIDNTNNTIRYSRGYIAKNHQLWRVNPLLPEQMDPNKAIYLVYRIENNYTPVTYQSGASFHVHQERVIDLVYRTPQNQPSGVQYQDWAILSSDIATERLGDLINRVAINTAHRVMVEQQAWTRLPNTLMTSMILSGLSGMGNNAQCRYKVIGKQLFLELSLNHLDTSQTASPFELQLPSNLKIAATTNFSLIAYASLEANETCRVEIKGHDATYPNGVMLVHHAISANAVFSEISFSVVLELD